MNNKKLLYKGMVNSAILTLLFAGQTVAGFALQSIIVVLFGITAAFFSAIDAISFYNAAKQIGEKNGQTKEI